MAILGIGTDIVDVARIERLLRDKRDEFLARVFSPDEVAYCDAKARPAVHFAARFAAKEALMKAIGTGWAEGVGFQDIHVTNDPAGKPILQTQGETRRKLDGLGPSFLWLSLSHTREYAMAVVVIEKRG
ncbi:MAG: holo-ACP synthase [Planctomycetes bacterium]|jgi:holo-[acyl-carrier protein] synthase|nr:holo-ACP synthase [Planctomycetota bacterium]MCL4729356.1 holo-ACP synthase [Planctomycetota bacterium]